MNDFISLSLEYLEAGEALSRLEKRSNPVAFCYIQSTELLLKGLAQQRGTLTEDLRKSHDFLTLWDSLNEPDSNLRHIVESLSPLDPKTTRFRYPARNPEPIDLDSLGQNVIALHQAFNLASPETNET